MKYEALTRGSGIYGVFTHPYHRRITAEDGYLKVMLISYFVILTVKSVGICIQIKNLNYEYKNNREKPAKL